jgi:peptidoglycan-associated lipoprotein
MRKTVLIAGAVLALSASTALAQMPGAPLGPTPQAQFVARTGSDSVYFGPGSYVLDPQARATLAAQALYFNMNPFVRARIEGHSDERGTRDYSLAIAERRAAVVRNFLVSLGVEPARLTVVAWGKERPASGAIGPATAALNRRVATVIEP